VSFLRGAFNDGLIDPDFITNSVWEGNQIFSMGRAGTLMRQVVPIHINNIYMEWVELNPDIVFWEAVEILQSPQVPGITPVYLIGNGFWSETMFSSRLDDATMDKIMTFFDWMLSDDGINTMNFGFEGQDWEMQNGEITLLTDINPDTGLHLSGRDLYQFAAGGMSDLVIWSGDAVEWFTPNIPQGIREMAAANRERVIVPGREYVWRDNRFDAVVVDEVVEMGLPSVADESVAFITNTTSISNQELWQQFRDRWESMGYLRAKELMTEVYNEVVN